MTRILWIAGTGTDIGKTFCTAVLAHSCIARGKSVSLCKVLQTGTDYYDADPVTIRKRVPGITPLPEPLEIPYRYPYPASPDFAARLAHKTPPRVSEIAEHLRQAVFPAVHTDLLLCELAGGLAVPLNAEETNLDLLRATEAEVLLVGTSTLGALNPILLSLEALERRNLRCRGIVMNLFPREPDPIAEDNLAYLTHRFPRMALTRLPENAQQDICFETEFMNQLGL